MPTLQEIQQAIVARAQSHEGKPYFIGAIGPDSFDCNGHLDDCWSFNGVQDVYPWQLRHAAADYPSLSQVAWEDRAPGDAVCFGDPDTKVCHHVCIVLDADHLQGANHGSPKNDGESDADYVKRMAAQDGGAGARVCTVPSTYWWTHRLCVVRPTALSA
jgi:cell wall-associated NlpC family hydrolase